MRNYIISAALFVLCGASAAAETPLQLYAAGATVSKRILPDTPLEQKAEQLRLTATPGEYEPVSWVVRSEAAIPALSIEVTPLRSADGAEIAADRCDVKVVKCWYQAGTADGLSPLPDAIAQAKDRRVLVPELLLHDDGLVFVEPAIQRNFLRLRFPESDRYWDVSDSITDDTMWVNPYPAAQYPVADAPALLPFDLAAAANRQLWLTVHVPEDAAAGEYAGTVRMSSAGKLLAELPLHVTVLPFRLDDPHTNYDPDREFVSTIYYLTIAKAAHQDNLNLYHRSLAQYEAELRNLIAHGVTTPAINQLAEMHRFDEAEFADLTEVLQVRRKLGLASQPVFLIGMHNLNYEDSIAADAAGLKQLQDRARQIIAAVQENLGHSDVYFYGLDEARTEALLKGQVPFWQALQAIGGKVWVSGYKPVDVPPGNFAHVGKDLDVLACANAPEREESAKWHSENHRIFNYANPQVGLEDAGIYRRNFGLLLYLANYDGAANFCYSSPFGNPWNDFDHTHWRDHSFVYPTVDGVIDTVQWEGYREGIDDIRYASTLRRKIRNSAKPEAAAAAAWLDQLEITPDSDMDAIRSQMISWILALQ